MEDIGPLGPDDILSLESVKRLLGAGLTEEWRHGFGLSLFHLMAMSPNAAGVQYLMSQGWNPEVAVTSSEVSSFEDMAPIHFAAYCGRTECLNALIQVKDLANHATNSGLRALHFASIGNNDAAEILIVMGANCNALDRDGENPFIYACGAANIGSFAPDKILDLLIDKGADPTVVSATKLSGLHLAADVGSERWAERFLDFGIDVNCVTSSGETPLHRAARFNHDSTCRFLIQRGAKLDVKNAKGKTPLSLALERLALDAARVLLENGATGAATNPKAKPHGQLHISWDDVYMLLERRHENEACNMVRALIRAGADVNAGDEQGIAPLHICFLPDYLGRLRKELSVCYSDLVMA